MMDAEELLLVKRQIAGILDHPSVYMGGPSAQSMKKAEQIISCLESGHRLHSTKCAHGTWRSYREHGTFCPTCGTDLHISHETT